MELNGIKLDQYSYEPIRIPLNKLKGMILCYHYGNYNGKCSRVNINNEMKREMIITKIQDCHHDIGTILFSINGSPPKGRAILFKESYTQDWRGKLMFMVGNYPRNSKEYDVEIIKDK